MSNIVTAVFGGSKTTRTRRLWKIDRGMQLQFVGLNLPAAYQVHFANEPSSGQAKVVTATSDTVEIPYEYLQTGADVYAWVYLTPEDGVGYTEYMVTIPVYARPDVTDEEPTPTQQSALDTAISALNSSVESVQAAVAGVQYSIDAALQEAKDSGEFDGADGYSPSATVTQTETGATVTITDKTGTTTAQISNGQDGAPGSPGNDGVSPTISVADITGGHRVTITDATGAHSFNVMDGEDGQGAVQDVQIAGTSVLSDGVANVPMASPYDFGVVKISANQGITIGSGGLLRIYSASDGNILEGTNTYMPIVPNKQHRSVFYGLAKAAGDTTQSASSNAVGQYTDSAKSAISEMLNGSVSVSGTTPAINALPGIRYVCGEVATLDITLPASGIVDVVFTSGSTPAVLTVTPPSGMTMRWANGFDPTSLEADTTYEINIADGLGVAASWT